MGSDGERCSNNGILILKNLLIKFSFAISDWSQSIYYISGQIKQLND